MVQQKNSLKLAMVRLPHGIADSPGGWMDSAQKSLYSFIHSFISCQKCWHHSPGCRLYPESLSQWPVHTSFSKSISVLGISGLKLNFTSDSCLCLREIIALFK